MEPRREIHSPAHWPPPGTLEPVGCGALLLDYLLSWVAFFVWGLLGALLLTILALLGVV